MTLSPAADWTVAKRAQTPADVARLASYLRIDPTAPGAAFALSPFTRTDTDDGPALAAVMQPPMEYFHWPMMVVDHDGNHFEFPSELPELVADRFGKCATDSDVLLVDRGTMHRDPGARLIIADDATECALYTDARAFARDWASHRMTFVAERTRTAAQFGMDKSEPIDGCLPGALLIGNACEVAWPPGVRFHCPDKATADSINRAVSRGLSVAVVAAPAIRIAA